MENTVTIWLGLSTYRKMHHHVHNPIVPPIITSCSKKLVQQHLPILTRLYNNHYGFLLAVS